MLDDIADEGTECSPQESFGPALGPVNGGRLDGLAGVVFAEAGDVSAQIKQDLIAKNVEFIAKPTPAMAGMRWHFDQNWAQLYKQRQVAEGVFSRLKNRLGLPANSCRSAPSLRFRVLASRKSQAEHS